MTNNDKNHDSDDIKNSTKNKVGEIILWVFIVAWIILTIFLKFKFIIW